MVALYNKKKIYLKTRRKRNLKKGKSMKSKKMLKKRKSRKKRYSGGGGPVDGKHKYSPSNYNPFSASGQYEAARFTPRQWSNWLPSWLSSDDNKDPSYGQYKEYTSRYKNIPEDDRE